jgi:hypothetical protein
MGGSDREGIADLTDSYQNSSVYNDLEMNENRRNEGKRPEWWISLKDTVVWLTADDARLKQKYSRSFCKMKPGVTRRRKGERQRQSGKAEIIENNSWTKMQDTDKTENEALEKKSSIPLLIHLLVFASCLLSK